MGQLQVVGIVIKRVSLVIVGVNVRVIVKIHITTEEHVQDVNNGTKLTIMLLTMKTKNLKHYHS